jgi:lysophospholipase L1-like esterase
LPSFFVLAGVVAACGSSSSKSPVQAGDSTGTLDAGVGVGVVEAGPDVVRPDPSTLPKLSVWIAGDSTVENYLVGNAEGDNGADLDGWGQEIHASFNVDVKIQNLAIGGRSIASFLWSVVKDPTTGLYQCVDDQGDPEYMLDASGNKIDAPNWAIIEAQAAAGDYVLIQFGTNDITNVCPRYVSTADFETDFGIAADAVTAKGAIPLFVTPMAERIFNADGTTVDNVLQPYVDAMKDEATMKGVTVLDLNQASIDYYEMVGNAYLQTNIFDTGTTHFVKAGAVEMASLVASEIDKNVPVLAQYLLP